MKKHIWKKSFSISFVFHFVVVIIIGAMVAGFHQEIQRPKEELITVNLADTPEQIAKAQEKYNINHRYNHQSWWSYHAITTYIHYYLPLALLITTVQTFSTSVKTLSKRLLK